MSFLKTCTLSELSLSGNYCFPYATFVTLGCAKYNHTPMAFRRTRFSVPHMLSHLCQLPLPIAQLASGHRSLASRRWRLSARTHVRSTRNFCCGYVAHCLRVLRPNQEGRPLKKVVAFVAVRMPSSCHAFRRTVSPRYQVAHTVVSIYHFALVAAAATSNAIALKPRASILQLRRSHVRATKS